MTGKENIQERKKLTTPARLSYTDTLTRTEHVGTFGLSPEVRRQAESEFAPLYKETQKELNDGTHPFSDLPYERETQQRVREVWKNNFSWAKQVVFAGIGGAGITPEILYQALGQYDAKAPDVYVTGMFTDPKDYRTLTKKLDKHGLDKTAFILLSKSGTTAETISSYLYFKDMFEKQFGNAWKRHILVVADPTHGLLPDEVKQYDLTAIPTSQVGDRWAFFSSLGLVSAEAMGIDADELLAGAREVLDHAKQAKQQDNIPWQMAKTLYLLQREHGLDTTVFTSYVPSLERTVDWIRQIFAESLGKNGKGIYAVGSLGPRDQHSQLQYFNDGKVPFSHVFITRALPKDDIPLKNHGSTGLDHFGNHTMGEITNTSAENTRLTLANYGKPSIHLELSDVTPKTLGSLIATFQLVTLYLSKFHDVEPYLQPGVAQSRSYIDAILGRTGLEKERAALKEKKLSIRPETITFG